MVVPKPQKVWVLTGLGAMISPSFLSTHVSGAQGLGFDLILGLKAEDLLFEF